MQAAEAADLLQPHGSRGMSPGLEAGASLSAAEGVVPQQPRHVLPQEVELQSQLQSASAQDQQLASQATTAEPQVIGAAAVNATAIASTAAHPQPAARDVTLSSGSAQTSGETAQVGAREVSSPSSSLLLRGRLLLRQLWMQLTGLRVKYPCPFRLLCGTTLVASMVWGVSFLTVVIPQMNGWSSPTACKFTDDQLRQNARMLGIYFVILIVVRIISFLPGVAAYVVTIRPATHGFCRLYCIHLVVHGPLYIFSIGSLLFWIQLMQSPVCEGRSPQHYRMLKLFATGSCLISLGFFAIVYWHNKLISDALVRFQEDLRRAPPQTLERLPTVPFDDNIFGDEDGKRYPSECSICLGTWEAEDTIKVTPCGHVFHDDCLGGWLKTERTCALCRQDVTVSPASLRRLAPSVTTPSTAPNATSAAATPSSVEEV
eukprot:TRINITY_DN101348_c0_g1_i1.p1 TRINITY_DN101348_c0_g1~~TRINITY_DN101348_c0_g1_i1.p1  ORF type:complete len:430 (-),score=50.41 TRINITY_DN101348_c0_g1_i1:259-1548(-)